MKKTRELIQENLKLVEAVIEGRRRKDSAFEQKPGH